MRQVICDVCKKAHAYSDEPSSPSPYTRVFLTAALNQAAKVAGTQWVKFLDVCGEGDCASIAFTTLAAEVVLETKPLLRAKGDRPNIGR